LSPPDFNQPFVVGRIQTPVGPVPQVLANLRFADHLGTVKARFGIGRMSYKTDPGLYALGAPDGFSPVLVTSNYKLTFDSLRSALPGRNLWILVVDTDGVNVWCSAGKGSFSAEEVAFRIELSGLNRIVNHRRVILPQLSAPGVASHALKKLSGFQAVFGPVQAADIPEFLDSGFKATAEMRKKDFPLWERIELIPVELLSGVKLGFALILLFLLASGFSGGGPFLSNIRTQWLLVTSSILCAILAGNILVPALLPWVPAKSFSLKGVLVGIMTLAVFSFSIRGHYTSVTNLLADMGPWFLIAPSLSAYFAMNFTGCSTFTSLSGVKKEMRFAAPAMAGAFAIGSIAWFIIPFVQ
jgi:hypothetical protein